MSTCYAPRFPVFQPAMRIITAITQARTAEVTTSFDHGYGDGLIIRLDIPPADGMQQANQFSGPILVTGTTTFTVPLDTTSYDAFAIPVGVSPHVNTCAMVVPVGELNSILTKATRNVLPY